MIESLQHLAFVIRRLAYIGLSIVIMNIVTIITLLFFYYSMASLTQKEVDAIKAQNIMISEFLESFDIEGNGRKSP